MWQPFSYSLTEYIFVSGNEIHIELRRSPYYPHFYQGATIVPQSCWFIDIVNASKSNMVVVQSSKRSIERGNIKEIMPPMPVEREFIYGVLTSAEVLPFIHLSPNIAVLPVRPRGGEYEVITKKHAVMQGYKHLAKWLEEAERIWEKVRGAKKVDLYSRLDYQRKLTRQSSRKKYRVVYLTSGTYLSASIVENTSYDVETPRGNITVHGILIGHTLYRYDTSNADEAYYLVSVLNSPVLDELIKPM